jgi:hypothetical protein
MQNKNSKLTHACVPLSQRRRKSCPAENQFTLHNSILRDSLHTFCTLIYFVAHIIFMNKFFKTDLYLHIYINRKR